MNKVGYVMRSVNCNQYGRSLTCNWHVDVIGIYEITCALYVAIAKLYSGKHNCAKMVVVTCCVCVCANGLA